MKLPSSQNLPISRLKAAFANTSATYKFYWLLAILDAVEQGGAVVPKTELFARMLANAWYTVNYFKVSFGPQDVVQNTIRDLSLRENIPITLKKEQIVSKLLASQDPATQAALRHFDKNVPHWFLSAWFPHTPGVSDAGRRRYIYEASQEYGNQSLYALHTDYIVINSEWIPYLQSYVGILRDFTYWNLALFLQARNPNVPAIPDKLLRPVMRNSLTAQRKGYWNMVFHELGQIDCIFTNRKLTVEKYALDHFVPHAFVSHDLLWNLIPIDASHNSSKGDRLPDMKKFFPAFFELQKTAYTIMNEKAPGNRWLQDYLTVFPDVASSGLEYKRYWETMEPLVVTAANNGFLNQFEIISV